MGHPKRIRKKYESPKRPYERLEEEKALMKEFGLRKKREIWKAETELRNIRREARNLQAKKKAADREGSEREKKMIEKLSKLGLNVNTLDDVLRLTVRDILARRLQSILYKKGYANSIKQARQLIIHGHVYLNNRKLKFPSFIVPRDDEEKIAVNTKRVAGQVQVREQEGKQLAVESAKAGE